MTDRELLLQQRTWDLLNELNRHAEAGLITRQALVLMGAVQQLLPEERPSAAPPGPMRVLNDAEATDFPDMRPDGLKEG